MIIENWFAFCPSDSVSTQRFAFYYRDGNNQRVAEVTGSTARTLACYVLCRLALARGYTILSCTADFEAMRDYMDSDTYRSRMFEAIDLILDSILATPAMMIGTEAGGWGENVCDVTVGDYSSDDATCAFAIRTRTNDFVRVGVSYSVDLIAACAVLNALAPKRSFLTGRTTGTGDYVFPLLTYTPGHYQHSDGKADWIVRAGKIGYKYHSASNYGGGYGVFADALAPLVWELRSNPLVTSSLQAIERVYYLVQQLRSEVSTSTSNIHTYINDATASIDISTLARKTDVNTAAGEVVQAINPGTVARQSDISDALISIDASTLARKSDIDGLATTTQVDSVSSSVVSQVQSDIREQLEPVATKEDLLAQCSTLATKTDAMENRAAIATVEKDVADLKPSKIATAVSAIVTAVGVAADLRTISAPDDSPSQQRESPVLPSAPSPTTTTPQADYYGGEEI